MKSMKFKVHSPEHSEAIQKRLFELGYSWNTGESIINTEADYLFTHEEEDDLYFAKSIGYDTNRDYYIHNESLEATLDDLYNPEFFESDPKRQELDRIIEELKQALDNY